MLLPPGPLSRAVRFFRSISLKVNVMSKRLLSISGALFSHVVLTPGPERQTSTFVDMRERLEASALFWNMQQPTMNKCNMVFIILNSLTPELSYAAKRRRLE